MPKEAEFERIARLIKEWIQRGEYEPDEYLRVWLPKNREMAVRFGVGITTVQRALDRLSHDGAVIRRQGKGADVNPEWLKEVNPEWLKRAPHNGHRLRLSQDRTSRARANTPEPDLLR